MTRGNETFKNTPQDCDHLETETTSLQVCKVPRTYHQSNFSPFTLSTLAGTKEDISPKGWRYDCLFGLYCKSECDPRIKTLFLLASKNVNKFRSVDATD
jgi:hypothetical protein